MTNYENCVLLIHASLDLDVSCYVDRLYQIRRDRETKELYIQGFCDHYAKDTATRVPITSENYSKFMTVESLEIIYKKLAFTDWCNRLQNEFLTQLYENA